MPISPNPIHGLDPSQGPKRRTSHYLWHLASRSKPLHIMNERTRKLIGVIATVSFLILYCLIAMVVGAKLLTDMPGWIQLPGFILLGIGWLPVVMKIIRWMLKPGEELANE